MGLIKWEDRYSVKVMDMDKDHQKLIMMINTLFTAMKDGRGKTQVVTMVDEMLSYSKDHFSKEEAYMKKVNYADLASQQEQHSIFINKVNDLSMKVRQGNVTSSIEMLNFLNNWFIDHICAVDKKYSSDFNQHGIR